MNKVSAPPRGFMTGGRMARGSGRESGFTLVEIMVAIFIFAIVSAIAMGGYNELVKQSDIVDAGAARTRAIQSTMQRLNLDFTSLEPRPVRQPLGDGLVPALRADEKSADAIVEFTHSGWSNPAGVPRSTLQRVAYRIEEKKLIREYWLALDRTMTSEPESAVMLDGVKTVKFRFMDANRSWHDQWPPLGYSPQDAPWLRPIAVEVTLDLEDWGELKRLMEVSG
ncbi:type II secretion system minor pseudopilin GspJ [Peristeroidobacter soli]|jgi:general secretion pathway protein J|uniref:type II secretion system minor pseudopilin GspJ n=1 Tax=Peristeroidobacter soli TaxID=2497877 RepID=UPI00101CF53A|nr:type II secretion system minor pseudopilin GspJ [Peristeroidobacter soli]